MNNLIYAGGIYHDFAAMTDALATELSAEGIDSTVCFDLDECAGLLATGCIDLFTVYALRWRMLDGEKYIPLRGEWALEVSDESRASIENHVKTGGGLMALHTAVICFDDWPQWHRILGGCWVWQKSSHPPQQSTTVRIADPSKALTVGLQRFELQDEVYQNLYLDDGIEVLANATIEGDAGQHPVIWTHGYGAGRVFCDTLGHDAASIRNPTHASLLRRGARWAANGS